MSAYNLGSDIHTRQMLADALTFQGELFLSTSGASGALSTSLHFLALAMALIGFILILIRPAFQRPSVIGGWLLIFYIMFIGPAKAFNASSSGPDDYDDYNGLLFRAIDSSTDDPMAGRPFYLPQILSIHFVNTIKDGLALALFNSDGSIRDYHQELIKGHKLGALEGVSISDDGSAIAEVASYDRLCGDPRDLIKAPRTGYTEFSIDYDGAASDRTNPQRYTLNRAREDELRTRYFTMEDVFREGENYLYVGGDKAVEGARPPYATLYHTTSQLRANHDLYPEDDERVDRMVELHWLGMNKLLENIMGSGGLSEGSDTNVSESEGNLVMDAVESISGGASVDLSDVEYRWYMGPASAGVYVMETTAEIVGWFRDLLFGTTDSPQFILAPPEGYDDGTVPASLINADDDSLAYNLRRQNFLDFMRDQYSDWETFSSEQAELLQGDEVMAMPVAMTLIRDSIEDEDETVILSSAYTIPPENAGGSELPATNTVRTCLDFHKALRQRILARVGSKIGLSAAVAETLGNADNPTGSAAAEDLIRWFGYAEDDTTVEEIAADEGVDESVATTIRTVGEALESYVALSYLERTGNDLTGSETPDADTDIRAGIQMFQSSLVSMALNKDPRTRSVLQFGATDATLGSQRSQAAQEALESGESLGSVGGALGSVIDWAGKIGVVAITPFIGVTAMLVIDFLKTLIEIATLFIVLATPLLMLMGLMVPSYGLGVFILTTAFALVLAAVPVTWLFIHVVTSYMLKVITLNDQGFLASRWG